MKAIVPISALDLGGHHILVHDDSFRIMAERDRVVVISLYELLDEVDWVNDGEWLYCKRQQGADIIKVIRPLTDDERKKYRIPLWIQDEAAPHCCGKPMFFVGEIDDDNLCAERPPDAQRWWHDRASFYVFTCSKYLSVKAVGQQF